jgi:catechol 2,3-dioxygenase-like lactoylglutathione lyase family enzyme
MSVETPNEGADMYSLPMIAVRDVRASGRWYGQLLACRVDDVADDFGRVASGESVVLLLHSWDAEEHAAWTRNAGAVVGNGFVLWLVVEEFDKVYTRARALGAEILVEPHENAEDGVREFTLRDPDGYAVAIIESSARA